MNENQFEEKLIQHLSCQSISEQETSLAAGKDIREIAKYAAQNQAWIYAPEIKTTGALWENFKVILEQHNQSVLERPLSITEFNQIKKIISSLHTPYEAGQFLYGLNGVSQIEIDLDDGKHVFLTVFNQKEVGAGSTVYQVVNQIERPAVILGKQDRRFDVTLLMNGLPVIQIEEKQENHDVNEALNQMHQYIDENQYSDIYSTLQILIAMTPNNIKYMANTTSEKFNKDFAFHWQRQEDNSIVRNWKEFADSVLSIPMAHRMVTDYMILDGTENNQSLKVMRPYQVYATKEAVARIKNTDFEAGMKRLGYIWHTTGSGKTITSFKTAWISKNLPNVDKVVFVVDRIALTKQTSQRYRAYDPDGSGIAYMNSEGISDTRNTTDLSRKLKSKGNQIIITSVQKLAALVTRKSFRDPDKNIVFIVDEAHRSTNGDSFAVIQKAFKKSAWIGYTGTPMFEEGASGALTEDVFGKLLHAYTIRDAIADRNVLGFKVDFETTIDEEQMRAEYLPRFYRQQHPSWTEEQIQDKIGNLTEEDIDDAVEPSFYDENEDHVRLVVADIFQNWKNRSNEGRYNAILTTHVGGGRPSAPMAMMYFREFCRVNEERKSAGKQMLKIAVTFSLNTSNNDWQLENNRGLFDAIKAYNQQFGTNFGMEDVSGYTEDVVSRLNKTADDKNYLDIVIVIDQLLTGFDAPELNTIYVDRLLKGAGLIQAYSRTNRIADLQEKPWGRIVNYRWPAQNEKLMNLALATYANKESAILHEASHKKQNQDDGLLARPFAEVLEEVREIVASLREMTGNFQQVPASEIKKEQMLELLRNHNAGIAKLKQYDYEKDGDATSGFNYDDPDELITALGMEPEEERMLSVVLTNELKEQLAQVKNIPVLQIDIKISSVKTRVVDYDYLTELLEKLLNQIHDKDDAGAQNTKDKIHQFANSLDDRAYAKKIKNTADAIMKGMYPADPAFQYPANLVSGSDAIIQEANNISLDRVLQDFRVKWGIIDAVANEELKKMFERHKFAAQDLDQTGQIRDIIMQGSLRYQELAHDEDVQTLSRIKYRNSLREAIYKLADQLVE